MDFGDSGLLSIVSSDNARKPRNESFQAEKSSPFDSHLLAMPQPWISAAYKVLQTAHDG